MMPTQLASPLADSAEAVTALSRFAVDKVGASLTAVIQSALDGVIIADVRRRIVLVNQKAESMFGYPAKQLLEKSIDALLSPRMSAEQRRRLERIANTRKSGKRARFGLRALHASGEEFSVDADFSRVTTKGEMFLVMMLRHPSGPMAFDRQPRSLRSSELRKLAVSSQQTNEAEKRRFSKELYDDIGQRLSVLKLDLDWLESSLAEPTEDLPTRVAQMQELLDKVIMLTRNLASALRPPLLDDFGLMPAVRWMADDFQKRTSVSCRIIDHGMPDRLAEPIESAVFRVIQESLINIERHAKANNVRITFGQNMQCLELLIEDDGVGMAHGSLSKPGCRGLLAMQERIFILGGTITIQNTEPRGLAVHTSIPIDPITFSNQVL
ncbi:PAS domain-containing sensor histidine kinase [Noviherbaspirillum massiliense]|uniref:PAS domain-containing sensor histidine kinase n=1 Tax=Noviherbaspirillum massiliense TaxID=1465823 RepID=UPI000380A37D|nr:PAS domain-containing protein [Noviherbaspirillum massiliense]